MRNKIIVAAAMLLIAAGAFAQEAQAPPPQNPQDAKDVKYTLDQINDPNFNSLFANTFGFIKETS